MITKGNWHVGNLGYIYAGDELTKTNIAKCVYNADNAQLIAEAGNVANETGLSPKQLLEQMNVLLEACKVAFIELHGFCQHKGHTKGMLLLEKAIAKSEGK